MAQDPRYIYIQQFRALLLEATSHIASKYFHLPIVDRNGVVSHVYRERVYCYELYHCLRNLWHDEYPFTLNGEVDKNGHPIYRNTPVARLKPDLLVHIPGDAPGNLIVVEVKPLNTKRKQIEKDLCSLAAFMRHGEYDKGIYLIYGGTERQFNRYRAKVADFANRGLQCGGRRNRYNDTIDLNFLELCWHQTVGEQAAFYAVND